uniref:B30.2/SPRY domain-containing protein n=1 Tax=Salmo trutta TaxID=8032 RepID=A0A673X8Q1_SALTR
CETIHLNHYVVLSLPLSVSLCLSLSLSLFVPLSLCPSLSVSLSVSVSLCVPLSLCVPSLCPSLSVTLAVPLSLCPPLSLCLPFSLCPSLSVSLSVPFSLSLSPELSVSLQYQCIFRLTQHRCPSSSVLWRYSYQLTLDPNTANTRLSLSEGNRKVTYTSQVQPYPDHPDRFTNTYQVLCREGLSGRCYWEVEWTGEWVYTAVSYKDISRTGSGEAFGHHNKSWRLLCCSGGYCFKHNNVVTKVSGPQSTRVGVYLDHKAGTLSFYSVSDTMTLLHREQTTFTQPLYPGFSLNGTAELVKL